MTRLFLLRHAKAVKEAASQNDHGRSLSANGIAAAGALARHLSERRVGAPDLVLCSTADRARLTLELILTAWAAAPPPVEYEQGLYLCGPAALLARLRGLPDSCRSVLLVGHNPDMHLLAVGLAAKGPAEMLSALRHKYPTGGWTELDIGSMHWADLAPGGASLVDFVTPRNLT